MQKLVISVPFFKLCLTVRAAAPHLVLALILTLALAAGGVKKPDMTHRGFEKRSYVGASADFGVIWGRCSLQKVQKSWGKKKILRSRLGI